MEGRIFLHANPNIKKQSLYYLLHNFIGVGNFATPLMNNFLGDVQVDENQPSPIEKVYVKNSTSLPNIDFTTLTEDETLKHLEFEIIKDNFDAIADKIEEKEETSVILTIKEDLGFYNLEFLKASKGPVKDNNMYYLGDMITEKFYTFS